MNYSPFCERLCRNLPIAGSSPLPVTRKPPSPASSQAVEKLSRTVLSSQETLAAAMEFGIQHPKMPLDSLGAVFLSNQNPFAGMLELDNPRSRSRVDE